MFKKILLSVLTIAGLLGLVYAANWPTTVSSDSNLYIAKNNCGTSLTSNITSAVTTIPASNTACFATVGYITIGEEAILCTGKTGTTFTGCTRGSDGTTAVAHISGDEIGAFFVAAHHNKLKDELIAISTSFLQGAQFHTDFTNTRFGIGTASPGTVLQVNIPGSDNGILVTDGGSNYNSLFQMSRSGAVRLKMTTGSLIGNIYGNGGLNLGGTLDTDHVQIDSAGNLGVGGAPSGNFDVRNTGTVVGTVRTTSTSGTRAAILRLNEANTGANDGSGQLRFTYDTDYKQSSAIKSVLTSGGTAGIMKFYTAENERMKLDENGYLLMVNSTPNQVPALKGTRFGYSSAYQALIVGDPASSFGSTVSIGYDPSGNTSGSFSGDGFDVLFRNGAKFLTPNAANNSFYNPVMCMLDGKVGVGTASPAGKLHIKAAANENLVIDAHLGLASGTSISAQNDAASANVPLEFRASQIVFTGGGVGGNVGMGITPGATLHVLSNTGDVDSGIRIERTSATTGRYNLIVGSSGQLIIGEVDGGTKRITLGKTTGYLTVPGIYDQTTASAANVVVDSSGNLMRSTSARKYKKNITSITLDEAKKTLQVTPVKYQSKAPIDDPAEWHYGFVADDAGSIDPLLVTYDVKTSTTGVKSKIPENIQYERIVVPLLKLVQDLEIRVATLEAKVDTLEKSGK